MTMLKKLADSQNLILLAEIGALIHDLGKLSAEFVRAKAADGEGDDIHHLFLKRYSPQVPGFLQGHSSKQNRVETALKYLESVDTGEARTLHSYLETEYQANPILDLGGALKAYAKMSPSIAVDELIAHVETVVTEHKKLSNPNYGELVLAERVAQVPCDFLPDALVTLLNHYVLPAYPDEGDLLGSTVIGELIEGHHSPPAPWRVEKSEYLALLRARDGADGFDSWIDKGQLDGQPSQLLAETLIATAFGHETQRLPVGPDGDGLKAVRDRFAGVLDEELGKVRDGQATPAQVRRRIFGEAETAFRQALGETRRAANDVTLWDHCY
ncbi:MAG: hypothetical protein ISS50_07625, partial [Anaerolineae bacterium]|nr:hypothetical protein [Anaerolineae bacterium]